MNFRRFCLISTSFILFGCGQAPEIQPAQPNQLAIDKFREAVAQMKVAARQASLSEIRTAQANLATRFESDRPHLSQFAHAFNHINDLTTACQLLWKSASYYPDALPVQPGDGAKW